MRSRNRGTLFSLRSLLRREWRLLVATEIRRLADQTAVATYDIEQMVKDIQSAVSAGVMGKD